MYLKIIIPALLAILSLKVTAQEKDTLSGDYQGLNFQDFATRVEAELGVRFFYRDDWVKDLKVGNYPDCHTLSCLLDHLFGGTSLYYMREKSGNIIITKYFAIKVNPVEKDSNFLPSGEESGAKSSQPQDNGAYTVIGNPSEVRKPGNAIISGYITNEDTKESLPGVTVFVKRLATGTLSNEYGFYSLSLPRGIHLVQFSSIGLKARTIPVKLNSSGAMDVKMKSAIIPLKEVVVSAEKGLTLQRFEVGAEKINMISLKLLPTSLGETDILKSVLMMPGVQTVGEASAGFNVRGGSADQNLILLYGAPVYNSSHFFGFFSAVNSDIIRDVTLYKGGIPSRYGGRISSVLDIDTREGNPHQFNGRTGISPVTTHLVVEGPLIKDTLTYLFAARTTYSNWIFSLIKDPALQRSRASFYDLNGTVSYNPNKNNKIEISSYYSQDNFRFNTDTVYRYINNIVSLQWRHLFTRHFLSNISLNNSFYRYDISSRRIVQEAFILSHLVNSSALNADFNWFGDKHQINFGLNLTRYRIQPGNYNPENDSSLVVPDRIQPERSLEGALYVADQFTLTRYLSVNAGLRISTYFTFGPRQVMVYDPLFPRSISTITDTIDYRAGALVARYGGPEFRLSLNFRLSDRNSLKVNYNRTRQYVHLLSNSASISPTDTWKLSDSYLKPQIGDQVALGFYDLLFRNRLEFSVEVYYKTIRNMVDFKGGTNLVMDHTLEKDVVNVEGKAYGLELNLKKTEGKLRYNVGYTYSRTFLRSTGTFSEDKINSGQWFPANFDKPNDLILTTSYLVSRRVNFSADYTWSTGRPITFPVATYVIFNNSLVYYSDRNKYRIPDYSRLDLSLTLNGSLRSHRLFHPSWTFSVFNVLGRSNVYSVYFEKVGDVYKGYKLSVFARAIPSVTLNLDF